MANGNGAAAPALKTPPPPPPLTGNALRQINRARSLAAPKVNADFLRTLKDRLNCSTDDLCKTLKVSQGVLSQYKKKRACPDYILQAANEALAAKGLPNIPSDTPPAARPAKSPFSKSTKPAAVVHPPKGAKSEQVPSGFLDGLEERLEMRNV
ncbi:MAG TPA: hypothetical protein VK641_13465, partial [Terriglobales bacterium]|nr:hypothetical protein [Terriglobales bacterium]